MHRLLQVISRTGLHRIQVAAHVQTARQHEDRRVRRVVSGHFEHGASLEGTRPLVDDDKVNQLAPQTSRCLGMGPARPNFVPIATQNVPVVMQVFGIIVNQQHLKLRYTAPPESGGVCQDSFQIARGKQARSRVEVLQKVAGVLLYGLSCFCWLPMLFPRLLPSVPSPFMPVMFAQKFMLSLTELIHLSASSKAVRI